MSQLVRKDFPAKSLLNGLRSIGYSFSTAVADIIDNSISATATEIHIYSEALSEMPYFCILDNGRGMTMEKLDNAMLPGSNRDDVEDSDLELGRFGLGLKSASLSQCREFIVVTKNNGNVYSMAFDLDVIKDHLFLKVLTDEEISELPKVDKLLKYESGTLVIWTKFDKIEEEAKNFEESFRRLVGESKKHVELVFHRFYDEISIFYNEKRIERRDPFLLNSLGRQQTGRTSEININGNKIKVTPYTLPFAKTLTAEELNLLGNPKSIYDEQGFYLYRNKRLISWGNWLRMGIRSELNKLARIQVDIPSSLDDVWMLDVKKSSAKIPDKIRDRIKMSVEESIVRSKRTVRNPGVREAAPQFTVWERLSESDGNVKYQINRSLPIIRGLLESLNSEQKELLSDLLFQLEQSIPKYRINNDVMDSVHIVNDTLSVEEDELIGQLERCLSLFPREMWKETIDKLLVSEIYLSIAHRREEIYERLL